MNPKRIFMTGASGCIGHYVAEKLITETNHELFFLVRNPEKIKFDYESREGITILEGDIKNIKNLEEFLKTMNVAILAATSWGGAAEVFDVNVIKTIQLINSLDPEVCEQVLYFSTASILDRNNHLLKEAGELGTDYIRSKYDCLSQLPRLEMASKITVLFPTLVFGGDENKPYSHISAGIPDVVKWAGLIRWLKADASFHFLHGEDIAQVVTYLIKNPKDNKIIQPLGDLKINRVVLGTPPIYLNVAIREVCHYLGKKIYAQINLSPWLADLLIVLFRIQMASWDRFCLSYRHFTYENPINPGTLDLPFYCPSLSTLLEISGIPSKAKGHRE